MTSRYGLGRKHTDDREHPGLNPYPLAHSRYVSAEDCLHTTHAQHPEEQDDCQNGDVQ